MLKSGYDIYDVDSELGKISASIANGTENPNASYNVSEKLRTLADVLEIIVIVVAVILLFLSLIPLAMLGLIFVVMDLFYLGTIVTYTMKNRHSGFFLSLFFIFVYLFVFFMLGGIFH